MSDGYINFVEMWVWVARFKEHRWWKRAVCGRICVKEEVGWFEDLLLLVKINVCEGGKMFVEQGVDA